VLESRCHIEKQSMLMAHKPPVGPQRPVFIFVTRGFSVVSCEKTPSTRIAHDSDNGVALIGVVADSLVSIFENVVGANHPQ